MANIETKQPIITAQEKDELLEELASFLYDAYQDKKANDTIESSKGQNADNESENSKQ